MVNAADMEGIQILQQAAMESGDDLARSESRQGACEAAVSTSFGGTSADAWQCAEGGRLMANGPG